MADGHELESKPRGAICPIVVILAALYVLSAGPVAWACWQLDHELNFSFGSTFGTVYWPIIRLTEEVRWFGWYFDAYVLWFLR